jgi:hypothetical protein
MEPNTRIVKQLSRTILDTERISEVVHQDTQSEELILHSDVLGVLYDYQRVLDSYC